MPDETRNDTTAATPATVLDGMIAAGIDRARALAYLEASAVVVDGERVSDPNRPAPPARVTVQAS
ncbi:hypothetical protein [Pseudonocardia adelaidensis]|uniref:RNA-binding S4 domain-containing protein n=1 Tax=Pseudonocardia adelaidensis TaxID=648754 RepID=A0ABP9NSX2_9PSEU